jgi:hypothetical protein
MMPRFVVSVDRKLTAILCPDVYGYSRLMGEDEKATIRLSTHRRIIDGLIEQHHGRFVSSARGQRTGGICQRGERGRVLDRDPEHSQG